MAHSTDLHTAFTGHRVLASGVLADVALAVKHAPPPSPSAPVLIFNDRTGHQVDLNLSGTDEEVAARHAPAPEPAVASASDDAAPEAPRGRGRPKLGVVPREVTLLPRHWDWLAAQPGGASVALRKLVEQARRDNEVRDRKRERQEAAYLFMCSLAGNLPGFEEATRALYADDRKRYAEQVASWPEDVRNYALRLAWEADNAGA
ncbi:DUF2239 family protein [Achromobacter sp. Marseille-Q0513]|uniref:DUF2239 family protein n=1 Tax=Achromobacter sp. Marseille-Q0513 TaxID=2829161 RepID=UPI001B9A772C|nr:DUF2239 family protein [Achromobacter sp. Marseille-Q0513]MBR8655307.1 DUF2239 family protein [Achromobacter sp. Marseille-Q0513]